MIEHSALRIAHQEGATHRVKLSDSSFVAYRPSRVHASVRDIPGASAVDTDLAFRYASRFFAWNGSGIFVSKTEWVLCREIPNDAEVI